MSRFQTALDPISEGGTKGGIREESDSSKREERVSPILRKEGRLEDVQWEDPGCPNHRTERPGSDSPARPTDEDGPPAERLPPIRTFDPVCSAKLREQVLKAYPALKSDIRMRRLLAHVVFATERCEETGGVPVPYEVLAAIAGRSKQGRGKNFSGREFLMSAKESAFPGLEWVNHDRDRGLARRITSLGLERHVQQAILYDLARDLVEMEAPVHFVSGKRRTSKTARATRRHVEEKVANGTPAFSSSSDGGHSQSVFPDQSIELMRHMNGLSPRLFTTAVAGGFEDARAVALSIECPRKRASALAVLRCVRDAPKPLYQMSNRECSVRIFPATASMLTLPTAVRRALTRDWHELDLQSSQFAIAASEWRVTEVLQMLNQGYDVWTDISETFSLGASEWATVKPAFKRALYSGLFGMDQPALKAQLTRSLRGTPLEALGPGAAQMFTDHHVIAEMLEHRDQMLNGIEESGGAIDCFGREIEIREGSSKSDSVSARSVLAQLAQATELSLVYPALEVVRKQRDLHLVLWQHDGFSLAISDTSKAERYIRQVCAAVDAEAQRQGIPTRLVAK